MTRKQQLTDLLRPDNIVGDDAGMKATKGSLVFYVFDEKDLYVYRDRASVIRAEGITWEQILEKIKDVLQ